MSDHKHFSLLKDKQEVIIKFIIRIQDFFEKACTYEY